MATSNFGRTNTSVLYAVIGEEGDDFICDDARGNILCELDADSENKFNNNEHIFGNIYGTDSFCGVGFTISTDLIMQAGYYEGAVLDYNTVIQFDNGAEFEIGEGFDTDDTYDMIVFETENYGLATMNCKKLMDYIERSATAQEEHIETAYAMYCTNKLEVSARFSNGETMYSEVA